MPVCGYIHTYQAIYGPENKGSFCLEEKTKAVCILGRINYGGLWNVRPPIIDPHNDLGQVLNLHLSTQIPALGYCMSNILFIGTCQIMIKQLQKLYIMEY